MEQQGRCLGDFLFFIVWEFHAYASYVMLKSMSPVPSPQNSPVKDLIFSLSILFAFENICLWKELIEYA